MSQPTEVWSPAGRSSAGDSGVSADGIILASALSPHANVIIPVGTPRINEDGTIRESPEKYDTVAREVQAQESTTEYTAPVQSVAAFLDFKFIDFSGENKFSPEQRQKVLFRASAISIARPVCH